MKKKNIDNPSEIDDDFEVIKKEEGIRITSMKFDIYDNLDNGEKT